MNIKSLRSDLVDAPLSILSDIYWNIKKEKSLQISTSSNHFTAKFNMTVPSDRERITRRYNNESRLLQDLVKNLKKDDVFYDIGANTGIFSAFALKVLSEGSVIAFEPYPPNIPQLKMNLNKNGNNYKIFGVPLSEEFKIINFSEPELGTTGRGTASVSNIEGSFKTCAIPVDSLVYNSKIRSPDIVKIDVEGSEPLVMRGMDQTLNESDCRRLYIEIHLDNGERGERCVENFGETGQGMIDMIKSQGFEIEEIIKEDEFRWHIIADKNASELPQAGNLANN